MRDPLNRTVHIALVGCVSIMPLLVLPVMVGAFVDAMGLGERDAGLLASAGFLGAAAAALILAFRIHHLDLRRMTVLGLVIMVAADGASIAAAALPLYVLVALRFISGAAGAAVYGGVMSAYAAWREPDRAYGLFMALQFAVSGAGLFLLPMAIPHLGVAGIFALFTLLDLGALVLARALPDNVERAGRIVGDKLEWQIIFTLTALACLLAIGLYETAQMAHFTYIERIGVAVGLDAGQIGLALGLSSLLAIPAAFAVTWIGSRFGYFIPIAAATLVQVLSVALLMRADSFADYLLITCLFAMGWAFVLPYFQAIEARIDPGGSVVVAGSFATGAAGFIGPAGAAMLVMPGDYWRMLMAILVSLLVVIAMTRFVTHRLRVGDPVDP